MNGDGRLQWKDFEMARDVSTAKSAWHIIGLKNE